MGMIFKFFLIFIALIIFVPFFRRFLFHLLVGRQLVKEQRRANERYQQNRNGNTINIDPVRQKKSSSDNFKGGEYVDYEEIKD